MAIRFPPSFSKMLAFCLLNFFFPQVESRDFYVRFTPQMHTKTGWGCAGLKLEAMNSTQVSHVGGRDSITLSRSEEWVWTPILDTSTSTRILIVRQNDCPAWIFFKCLFALFGNYRGRDIFHLVIPSNSKGCGRVNQGTIYHTWSI